MMLLICYVLYIMVKGKELKNDDGSRAYFSVQYYTLCAVLMEKCAVLNAKMCSFEI